MKRSELILSDKLKKQLKSLERDPKYVSFSKTLDEVYKRINERSSGRPTTRLIKDVSRR